ncbi:SRPBCC family protein [Mycobacterium sp. IDR2000157661]|uniref:SRPBCC family protein n=1 Tax=Mycobacterium sp. IDR2000157661 TaxID=2867005 RepID=UPI001EECAEA9|nr:SRPBCC family protein [Mycobacterium sp. IDR2000157661]ULE34131.1 SRPBCC family protein [Mycobacterium sp. IDR2000157661]
MNRPAVTVSTAISAPAVRIWELVSDIGVMPRLSDELRSVEWVDGDGPRLGARFRGTNSHPAIGLWTTESVVVECDPPRVFAWAVGDPDRPAATWRFEVVPVGEAAQLRYTAEIGPGRSGVSMLIERAPQRREAIIANRLGQFDRAMTATIAGIKALAES